MKSKLFIIAGAALLSALFISMKTAETNTGSIKVTVLEEGKPSAEALVGVSTSAENLENSKYIFEEETNAAGVIIFKSVAPGTYYIDASSEDYYGEGKVTVTDTEASITLDLTAEEDEE